MEWQQPHWLYLILPLGAAWLALAVYSRRRRQRAATAFVAQPMWPRILPVDSTARFWIKNLLREAALVAGLVALAGPQFGTQYETVVPKGSDLYVLIDVSRSMLAQDVPPSRLGRAKADVAALVNRLDGERVGLIAFAGQAVVKCPLTVDYDAFRRSLEELDPNSAPRGGTAIGDAIRKALEVFQVRAERDQAILLITDGDDQQSYPREAAATAAERHVTIFTVGLGDSDHGARIPETGDPNSYVEYKGQQVWSKLDGALLKDIALKTSGVYVPVGTRSYDLGELYTKYLQGRRGADEQSQQRIRRGDQFQIFLALALFALLIDGLTSPYPRLARTSQVEAESAAKPRETERSSTALRAATVGLVLAVFGAMAGASQAASPERSLRDGLHQYGLGEFAKAQESFASAREQFDRNDAGKSAIAAFDQACAAHRKGDVAQAKEWYLKASLAPDKPLAASAHFNLGTLEAEEAKKLAGEHPETVPPEKRTEILEKLKAAVASFRHCLDLEPENASARRDLELVRQWVKYYSDRWQALDREKRRRETNLLAFVEFLMESQNALEESVKSLGDTATADTYFELKRAQDELSDEISPLKEKINTELQPKQGGPPGSQVNSGAAQKGIEVLQRWASAAGEKMASASHHLDHRSAQPAAADQQAAIEELEKIWDAIIPFQPLLARDLQDQTHVTETLKPESTAAPPTADPSGGKTPAGPAHVSAPASIGTEGEDLAPLIRTEERTQRRTQLLKLKAEVERDQLAKAPPAAPPAKAKNSPPAGPNPEALKAGYQKAIELAPRAAEQMNLTLKALRQKDRQAALPPAEEARKILEAIQKAQPPNEQPDQKNQDQKKEDQKKQEQKKNDDRQKQQPKDQPKDQKNEKQKKQEDKQQKDRDSDSQKKEQPQQQAAKDQVEALLRKVRERQQEKRERDRQLRARLLERAPVEKNW